MQIYHFIVVVVVVVIIIIIIVLFRFVSFRFILFYLFCFIYQMILMLTHKTRVRPVAYDYRSKCYPANAEDVETLHNMSKIAIHLAK